jgi:DNA-binding NarL/FixJ family response regulator
MMKVLIIEREKTIQQSLYLFIERYKKHEVFLASSRREGISLFERVPFDIVLCGDLLPDGNGLETLTELVKQNPKLVSILMTIHGDEASKQEAIRAGIRGYLEKPFDLKHLEEALAISDFACLPQAGDADMRLPLTPPSPPLGRGKG